jgi:hypothetical protein
MSSSRERPMDGDNAPWYRQGWPWFLISLPATAVIAGLATYYIAARGFDGPVVADYYKQGLAINEELGRSHRARDLGIEAKVALDGLAVVSGCGEPVSAQPLPVEAALRCGWFIGKRDADRLAIWRGRM